MAIAFSSGGASASRMLILILSEVTAGNRNRRLYPMVVP